MQYDYLKKGNRVLWGSDVVTITSEPYYPFSNYGENGWIEEQVALNDVNPSEHYVKVEYRHTEGNLCHGTTVNELRETEVRIDQLTEIRDFYNLDEQEVKDCFSEWHRGSIYLHHYANSYGVTPNQAMECYDAFWSAISSEFGEEADQHDNAHEFFMWLCGENT